MIRASKRVAIGVAVALIGLSAASGQALAASGNDGTSNTIQFGVAGGHLPSAEAAPTRFTIP